MIPEETKTTSGYLIIQYVRESKLAEIINTKHEEGYDLLSVFHADSVGCAGGVPHLGAVFKRQINKEWMTHLLKGTEDTSGWPQCPECGAWADVYRAIGGGWKATCSCPIISDYPRDGIACFGATPTDAIRAFAETVKKAKTNKGA